MGPIGEEIMEIAYQEYLKEHAGISFDEWFDTIVLLNDDFDVDFKKARDIYSRRQAK